MRKSLLVIFSIVLLSTLMFSCKKEDQGKIDREIIEAYVLEQGLDGQFNDDGLYYVIDDPGGEAHPTVYSEVSVFYKGYFLDGTVFDSSVDRGQPASFPVGGVIKGWQEALVLMPVGSKWVLYIPEDLAYGDRGAGPKIGPYSTLIFEIELII